MSDIPTDTRSRSVMDCQLQVVTVPVTDVDLAAAFYTQQAGFVLDVDYHPTPGFRVVQLTPPARPARSRSAPGSPTRHPDRRGPPTWPSPTLKPPAVNSPDAASASAPSATSHPSTAGGDWQPGADPQRRDYASLAGFTDPDGNTWVLQEIGFRAPAPLPAANPDLNYSHTATRPSRGEGSR
jgi:catechol 2,3-dioxygenase-like lactoylglutathione lyase family enzyme